MKSDTNPSLIAGLFGHPDKINKLIETIHGKNGMRVRELKLIDISMPMDERFDENINFLKHLSKPMLYRLIKQVPFLGIIRKQLSKGGWNLYEPKASWQNDSKNEFLLCGFTPIAFDCAREQWCETELEKKNFEKAKRFESTGYKPVREEIKPTDMKLIKTDETGRN